MFKKIRELNLINRIIYLFIFKASFKYKFWYIIWEIVKTFRLLTGKKLRPYFPKYLYWDYIIENEIWKFKIKEKSDMHWIINPYTERELLDYFLKYNDWFFLDIWANIWKYSILIWNKTNMKIFSFEPNTFLVDNYLSYNIKLNWLNKKIDILNVWLWKEKSELKIDLIKIDVEWFEYDIFLWAKDFFSKAKKCTLIIEIIKSSKNKNKTIDLIETFWFKLENKLFWDNYIFSKN